MFLHWVNERLGGSVRQGMALAVKATGAILGCAEGVDLQHCPPSGKGSHHHQACLENGRKWYMNNKMVLDTLP